LQKQFSTNNSRTNTTVAVY